MTATVTLAIFDVDGTLLDGASCEGRFFSRLLRAGMLGPRQVAASLLFWPRWGPVFGEHALKKNKSYLAGLPVDRVRAIAEAVVADDILPFIRPAVRARLEDHRARGHALALLTGTPDFIAAPLAAALGVALAHGARMGQREGVFMAGPPRFHPFGADKLVAARDLAEAAGADLAQAVAYADSILDLPLLRAVARPVAVTPDAPLRRIARREGWEILSPH